ncbi:TPA: DUF7336 domain-containing protein [Escherichia coli]|uniref:DUF7336 domain-containing protein n=1 Tax=Escherichia phage vB_EcoD_SU57 TaxID=2743969 RepID=A0A7D5G5L2_9CAUD|nr:hypothetical protein [Escherichia phage vB_EcoD_SU57]
MKVYILNAYTNYDGFEICGVFDTEELAELEKNRLLGIDIDNGYGPDYYQIEEFDLIVENNILC